MSSYREILRPLIRVRRAIRSLLISKIFIVPYSCFTTCNSIQLIYANSSYSLLGLSVLGRYRSRIDVLVRSRRSACYFRSYSSLYRVYCNLIVFKARNCFLRFRRLINKPKTLRPILRMLLMLQDLVLLLLSKIGALYRQSYNSVNVISQLKRMQTSSRQAIRIS